MQETVQQKINKSKLYRLSDVANNCEASPSCVHFPDTAGTNREMTPVMKKSLKNSDQH